MKQIGIKLADGTFYPIMEEGKPVKKTLGLTTVNDNQTRVIVDVYRSKTGTMEDAEYIDSLQIDNLVAHPNGTADINLNIGLDENNKLHAEMDDPETGATSNATVTLVSRTLEERLEPTNYDVKLEKTPQENPEEQSLDDLLNDSETASSTENNNGAENNSTETNNATDDFSELPKFDEEDFDIPDFENNDDETIVENPISEETFSEDKNGNVIEDSEENPKDTAETSETDKTEEFELPEFPEENPLEEPVTDETENAESQPQEFSDEDFELPDFDEVAPADEEISIPVAEDKTEVSSDAQDAEEKSNTGTVAAAAGAGAALGLLGAASLLKKKEEESDEKTEESPETKENAVPESTEDSTVVADKNQETPAEPENKTADQKPENSEFTEPNFDDFDLPDFNEDDGADEIPESATETSTEPTLEEPINADAEKFENKEEEAETSAKNDDSTIAADTNDSPFDDFQLPDFDTDSDSAPENDEKSVLDDDAFFDSITSDDNNSEKTKTSEDTSTLVNDNTPSNGINFDGLYDKETAAGGSADSTYENDTDEIKKKTKAPVIICIICAIICILATLLILFVVPSKYNLLNKNDKAKTETTKEIQQEPEEEIPETPAEPEEQKPIVIESKEEEVVVAPEPEQVIPETPKEPETKPADITYKIKWGDTLWDIADSYYKNPWNYKKIARYNNIKNPDYIISGTTITIPAK